MLKSKIFEFCGRHSYEQCPAALRSQPPLRSAAHAHVLADMDGSNWRQFLIEFEAILVPALEESGGAVPEATVLFSALRDIAVACSKSRADLKRHHILHTKLACFDFARSVCLRQTPALSSCCARRVRWELTTRLRQVECLVRDSYFTPRPINLYFACTTHSRPQLLATRS
eukprot:COSAG04_NODE_1357_length_7103_cov_8.062821_5_plen_171_part_00